MIKTQKTFLDDNYAITYQETLDLQGRLISRTFHSARWQEPEEKRQLTRHRAEKKGRSTTGAFELNAVRDEWKKPDKLVSAKAFMRKAERGQL